jgi:hypothetical protein
LTARAQGNFNEKIMSLVLPQLLLMIALLLMHIIIIILYLYYRLLLARDKEENLEVTGAVTTCSLK